MFKGRDSVLSTLKWLLLHTKSGEERVLILCPKQNTTSQNWSCRRKNKPPRMKGIENEYQLPDPPWFSDFPNSFGSPTSLRKYVMGNNSPCPLGAVFGNPSVTRREVAESPTFFLVGNGMGYDTDANAHTLGSMIPPDIGHHTDCLRTWLSVLIVPLGGKGIGKMAQGTLPYLWTAKRGNGLYAFLLPAC